MENETQKSGNKGIMIAAVVIVLLIVGYVLMNKNKTTSVTPSTTIQTQTPDTGTTNTDTAPTLTISASEFAFSPSVLNLKVGQPVTLVLVNNGKMPHDFMIDEIPGAKTTMIKAGESATVTFTPTTAGTFKFYCSVGNHRAQGMEGTVIVQ